MLAKFILSPDMLRSYPLDNHGYVHLPILLPVLSRVDTRLTCHENACLNVSSS